MDKGAPGEAGYIVQAQRAVDDQLSLIEDPQERMRMARLMSRAYAIAYAHMVGPVHGAMQAYRNADEIVSMEV